MGMDPKQMRALDDGEASPDDLPRDTSREAVRDQAERPRGGRSTGRKGGAAIAPGEAREDMSARREHSKGDGNFPEADAAPADERPEDRTPRDLPKAADQRSAPKGNITSGQGERNTERENRDEHRSTRPTPRSGMERAESAADAAVTPSRPVRRPTARRSSAAKVDAVRARTRRASGAGQRAAAKPKRGSAGRASTGRASTGRASTGRASTSRASTRRASTSRASTRPASARRASTSRTSARRGTRSKPRARKGR